MNPTITFYDVRTLIQDKSQKDDAVLYELKSASRLSHIGKHIEGMLYQGNIYHALLSIDQHLSSVRLFTKVGFLEHMYETYIVTADLALATPENIVDGIIECLFADEELWIEKHAHTIYSMDKH